MSILPITPSSANYHEYSFRYNASVYYIYQYAIHNLSCRTDMNVDLCALVSGEDWHQRMWDRNRTKDSNSNRTQPTVTDLHAPQMGIPILSWHRRQYSSPPFSRASTFNSTLHYTRKQQQLHAGSHTFPKGNSTPSLQSLVNQLGALAECCKLVCEGGESTPPQMHLYAFSAQRLREWVSE